MASVSYCISVCNESEELDRLLTQLISYIEDDELIIIDDDEKSESEIDIQIDDSDEEIVIPVHTEKTMKKSIERPKIPMYKKVETTKQEVKKVEKKFGDIDAAALVEREKLREKYWNGL